MSYAKLFSSITESSLWSEPKEVRLLFVTMLAKANSVGFVEASIPGLARVSNLTQQEVETAIPILENPDPFSKNPECDGRRIIKAPGGWMVLNYEDYRNRQSEEERREYMREYMRDYRKGCKQAVNNVKASEDFPSASSSVSASSEKGDARGKNRCTQAEAEAFCESIGLPKSDGEAMFLHWEEKGWGKVRDWKLTVRKWKSFGYLPSQKAKGNGTSKPRVLSFAERDRRLGQVRERRNTLFKSRTDQRTGAVREFTPAELTEYEALTKELKELDVCFSG